MKRIIVSILVCFCLGLTSHIVRGQEVSALEFMKKVPMVENPAELSLDPALQGQLETFFPYKSRNRKNLQRVIFSGNAKSQKIKAAQWIAFQTRQDAYRVQLSRVVSENIHETERNLGLVFDEAEGHEPILFFDEADALFNNKSEDDKTKLVNYFLGKAEDYRSTIILSLAQAKTLNPNLLKKFREVLEIK